MRLVSFGAPGAEQPGVLMDDQIVDLRSVLRRRGHFAPVTLEDLISLPRWRDVIEALLGEAAGGDRIPLAGQRLGAPLPRPSKVFVVGANTYSHVEESKQHSKGEPPLQPMVTAKAPTTVIGYRDDIVCPPEAETMDYEVELGVVIGRAARNIDRGDAMSAVLGFTVVNEMSDRNLQIGAHEKNEFYRGHFLGKSYDGFCPCGPAVVTPDEVGNLADPGAITLRSWVNDELRQDSTLEDLVFNVPDLVAYISRIMTLLPGDLICTGSPAGVGAFMDPRGYLKPGDTLRTEIGLVGAMSNRIVSAG